MERLAEQAGAGGLLLRFREVIRTSDAAPTGESTSRQTTGPIAGLTKLGFGVGGDVQARLRPLPPEAA
jgi:hypothetical protein